MKKQELSGAIVQEIERRKVTVLPIRQIIDTAPMPATIKDRSYADFSHSYEDGLEKAVFARMNRDVRGKLLKMVDSDSSTTIPAVTTAKIDFG